MAIDRALMKSDMYGTITLTLSFSQVTYDVCYFTMEDHESAFSRYESDNFSGRDGWAKIEDFSAF